MLTLTLRFPAGRYHATPWGRHVNEGVAEWPPSPWRLLRALVDCWHRKHPSWGEGRVLPLLEALGSAPPRFALPPARASHTRSYLHQNKEDPSNKKLIFDAFVVIRPESPVAMRWEDAVLSDQQLEDLDALLRDLNYLGRSESWVDAGVDRSPAPGLRWTCSPAELDPQPEGATLVQVACPEGPGSYARHPWKEGKGRKLRELSWLEALSFSTRAYLDQALSQPPGQVLAAYWLPEGALDARPPARRPPRRRRLGAVLYELSGPTLPSVIESLELAEQARVRVMGAHKKVLGHGGISTRFSGKDEMGQPLRERRHLRFLPRDLDGDGRIDHLLLWGPDPLDDGELQALAWLRQLYLRHRPDLDCAVSAWGDSDSLRPGARTVESATPFLPPRHRKPRRDGPLGPWLEAELRRELGYRGLPEPESIERVERLRTTRRRIPWGDFRRNRKGDPLRPGFGFRLRFHQPVPTPFTLGYGAHFGLGMFEEAREP